MSPSLEALWAAAAAGCAPLWSGAVSEAEPVHDSSCANQTNIRGDSVDCERRSIERRTRVSVSPRALRANLHV